MKKLLFILLCIFLCSCSVREDYNTLNVDGYQFSIGYDDVEYLKTTFDFDIIDELEANEVIEDIDVKLFGDLFCQINVSNYKDKSIDSSEAIISKLTIYCLDVGNRTYKLNDIELDTSVSSNCSKFNGNLINRNGVACVIESTDNGSLNVVELHGDILASDQDCLDHIIMYIK